MVVFCLTCKWVGHGSGILHEESWSTLLIFTTRITSATNFARNSFIYKQGRIRQENLINAKNVKSTHNRIFWSHKHQQGLCCPFCNTGWSISLTSQKITEPNFGTAPKSTIFLLSFLKCCYATVNFILVTRCALALPPRDLRIFNLLTIKSSLNEIS